MESVTFNAEDHKYTYFNTELVNFEGQPLPMDLPSVTTIIKDAGLSQNFDNIKGELDWYGDRGSKIHKACHLFDQNNLDEDSLAPEIKGYLEGWKRAKLNLNLVVMHSELIVYDPVLGYAGTLDKFGTVKVKKRKKDAIIDLKSGTPHPSHGVQLAAYRMGFGMRTPVIGKAPLLYGVYLRDNGGWFLHDYSDLFQRDSSIFRAALTCYNAKRRFHE